MTDFEIQLQGNAALVQRLYAAFAQRDIPAILETLAADIDWLFYGPDDIPFAGAFRGHAEVERFFTTALDTSEFLVFEPREIIPAAGSVLVQGYEMGRARSTGRIWECEWAHVFTVQGEKITKMREYYDTAVVAGAF